MFSFSPQMQWRENPSDPGALWHFYTSKKNNKKNMVSGIVTTTATFWLANCLSFNLSMLWHFSRTEEITKFTLLLVTSHIFCCHVCLCKNFLSFLLLSTNVFLVKKKKSHCQSPQVVCLTQGDSFKWKNRRKMSCKWISMHNRFSSILCFHVLEFIAITEKKDSDYELLTIFICINES